MKNNIMLKGILVFTALYGADFVVAKGEIRQQPQSQQGGSTVGNRMSGTRGTTTSRQAQQANLSRDAIRLLRYGKNFDSKELRDRFQEEQQAGTPFTKNDIDAINAEISKLETSEQASQTKAVLSDKDQEILQLRRSLERQEILFNQLLAKQEAAEKPGMIATMASLPVVAAIAGFDKLAYWIAGRENWDTRLKGATGLLKMQLDDLGKYPTVRSKLAGIAEQDFKNISHIDAKLFSEALKELQILIKKEGNAEYQLRPQEKARQEKIDNFIIDVRKKYGYQDDEDSLKKYKNAIEQNEKDLDKYRAIVSEYLRATSKIAWLEEEKKRKAEEEKKQKEQQQSQQQSQSQQGRPQDPSTVVPQPQEEKSSGWLSGWRWGG